MRILTTVSVFVICLALLIQPGQAQSGSQPLPALPGQAVLDKIIQETGGPSYTPLGVPAAISNQLLSTLALLNSTLASETNVLDVQRAVYYARIDGGLTRIVIPLAGTSDSALEPDMQTPDDKRPARVVGAVVELDKATAILVVVWKDQDKTKKPADLRFYSGAGGRLQSTTPYKLSYRKLKGDKQGKVAPGDQGALIASRETCFTIGLDQVCYAPDKHSPDSKASTGLDEAYQQLAKRYALKVKFDLDGALPDIAGTNWRTSCADKLAEAADAAAIANTSECAVTILFTAATQLEAGQPIGLIRVLKDIEQKVYDLAGNQVGRLPAGYYLILDAMPNVTEPGAPSVLMLVNADGSNHYLIPSQVVEGFGDSDDKDNNSRRGQAAIKDANVGFHGF